MKVQEGARQIRPIRCRFCSNQNPSCRTELHRHDFRTDEHDLEWIAECSNSSVIVLCCRGHLSSNYINTRTLHALVVACRPSLCQLKVPSSIIFTCRVDWHLLITVFTYCGCPARASQPVMRKTYLKFAIF